MVQPPIPAPVPRPAAAPAPLTPLTSQAPPAMPKKVAETKLPPIAIALPKLPPARLTKAAPPAQPQRSELTVMEVSNSYSSGNYADYHALVLLSDGSVRAWGANEFGQLGNGTKSEDYQIQNEPTKVIGLPAPARAIGACVQKFSVALLDDGTVWQWGLINHNEPHNVPVKVGGLPPHIIAVSAGNGHVLALDNSGTVWAWGDNINGQLGDGKRSEGSALPVEVVGLPQPAVAICAGDHNSLALLSDGTAWEWGSYRTQGIRQMRGVTTPVQITGTLLGTGVNAGHPVPIVAIAERYGRALALGSDGEVRDRMWLESPESPIAQWRAYPSSSVTNASFCKLNVVTKDGARITFNLDNDHGLPANVVQVSRRYALLADGSIWDTEADVPELVFPASFPWGQ